VRRIVAVALALAVLVLLYGSANAARSTAQCWFADGYLYATGLPIGVEFSITSEPYPTGVHLVTQDGTWSGPTWATAAYFWTRGHGPSLIKAGPQLNDYSVKAVCFA
jgi:hypothetical protein